jgi:hypothetical protein
MEVTQGPQTAPRSALDNLPNEQQHFVTMKREGQGGHVRVATEDLSPDVNVVGVVRQQPPKLPGPIPPPQHAPLQQTAPAERYSPPPQQHSRRMDRSYTSLNRSGRRAHSEIDEDVPEPPDFDDKVISHYSYQPPKDTLGMGDLANPDKMRRRGQM